MVVDVAGAVERQSSMANLLLVDDDNDIVEALGDLLRGEGHEVHSASTGEEVWLSSEPHHCPMLWSWTWICPS